MRVRNLEPAIHSKDSSLATILLIPSVRAIVVIYLKRLLLLQTIFHRSTLFRRSFVLPGLRISNGTGNFGVMWNETSLMEMAP